MTKAPRTTGFPSPSEDHMDGPIDLVRHIDLKNPAKKLVILPDCSFPERGVLAGDVLVVDTSKPPLDNRLVVASYMGRDVLGALRKKQNKWFLVFSKELEETPIIIEEGCDLAVLGVVVSVIRVDP